MYKQKYLNYMVKYLELKNNIGGAGQKEEAIKYINRKKN